MSPSGGSASITISTRRTNTFSFMSATSSEYVSYNTKSVEAGEIRSYWDFLQPKWKGKILSRDPKISGSQRIGLRGCITTRRSWAPSLFGVSTARWM